MLLDQRVEDEPVEESASPCRTSDHPPEREGLPRSNHYPVDLRNRDAEVHHLVVLQLHVDTMEGTEQGGAVDDCPEWERVARPLPRIASPLPHPAEATTEDEVLPTDRPAKPGTVPGTGDRSVYVDVLLHFNFKFQMSNFKCQIGEIWTDSPICHLKFVI